MELRWAVVVVVVVAAAGVNGEGYVGCSLSSDASICEGWEECVNDDLFGTCRAIYDSDEPIYLYDQLDDGTVQNLQDAIRVLVENGYGWTDGLSQCVLRSILQSFRYSEYVDVRECVTSEANFGTFGNYDLEGDVPESEWAGTETGQETEPSALDLLRSLYGSRGGAGDYPSASNDYDYPAAPDLVGDYGDDLLFPAAPDPSMFGGREGEDAAAPGFNGLRNDGAPLMVESPEEKDTLQTLVLELARGQDADISSLSRRQVDKLMMIVKSMIEYIQDDVEETELPTEVAMDETKRDDTQKQQNLENGGKELNKEVVPEIAQDSLAAGGNLVRQKYPKAAKYSGKDGGEAEKTEEQRRREQQEEGGKQKDVVDASYAYVKINRDFKNGDEAGELLWVLADLSNFPNADVFSDATYQGDTITFKVNTNPQRVNASTIAKQAVRKKAAISEKLGGGAEVQSAGVGRDTQVKMADQKDDKLFILTFVVCGCVAVCCLGVVVVFIMRRNSRARDKLASMAHDGEGTLTDDYKDLCRQRMGSKTRPDPVHTAANNSKSKGRNNSVQGDQKSPSSRSSTSSWNEEPASNNMDISTGHIVLNYMEDHLKNQARLEEEWSALCKYEAEPNCTNAASNPANSDKNRYNDVLPYDHSRVILNDSTNLSASDYINANTITDHDPRNPAYIVTQGPLANTAADFWQMVWEQGSVVVVTLTRLEEEGRKEMCFRYWPEEGSQLYHIYEVHLVSEHIWCDDYIVRSFYLKNIQTNETRTVTQFHFLSWGESQCPQSSKSLLEFRRKVNKSYRGRSCPVVIHCNDGVGRTGTYCLLDMVLSRMTKGAKEIDIAATLEHIRDQRGSMVKTKEQFEFALSAVAEEVHAILKALPQ